jgi:hypothetical protein
MKLTVCLVSKGRPDFLPSILGSFDNLLDLEEVDFLIIDNGSDPVSCELLSNWASVNSSKSAYIRYDENDPRPSRYWSDIYAMNLDWILMPGDDDILVREGILSFLNTAKARKNVNVIGGSAHIIDQHGVSNGKSITPVTSNDRSNIENFVSALHGPGFIWPATFFKPGLVGANVPSSRFAFDWYLDCIFILNASYVVLEDIVLKYRIHSSQETNLASLRRKYFEGFFWLSKLIKSQFFMTWLSNLDDAEVAEFWSLLMSNRPVYGDEEFGKQLTFHVAERILILDLPNETLALVSLDLATLNNVFLSKGEIRHFLNFTEERAHTFQFSNVRFIPTPSLCINNEFFEIEERQELSIVKSFEVYCRHAPSISNFEIDCTKYKNVQRNNLQEMLLMDLEFHLQKIGFFEGKLTSLDRKVLSIYPSIISKLPKSVTKMIKFLLKLGDRKHFF